MIYEDECEATVDFLLRTRPRYRNDDVRQSGMQEGSQRGTFEEEVELNIRN